MTQAAISHQVKSLEDRLGVSLFRRSNRGLLLTDEGVAPAPTLFESFGAIDRLFDQFESGGAEEVLTVGRDPRVQHDARWRRDLRDDG